jgi:hypothetical protein
MPFRLRKLHAAGVDKHGASHIIERRRHPILLTVAMSIYTARLLKGNQRPNPVFKTKGLTEIQPCSLSNSGIRGFPHQKQIAYSAYTQFLSAFLFATEKQSRVMTNATGYPISLDKSKVLDHQRPPIGVAFTKKLTKDQVTALEGEYKLRVVENMGQTIYIFDDTTLELAKKMVDDKAIPSARTPAGVANLVGLQAFEFCWKILTLFWYVSSKL